MMYSSKLVTSLSIDLSDFTEFTEAINIVDTDGI